MIFRHPISTLTRITTSTLKYASSNTANLLFSSTNSFSSEDYPHPQQIQEWMENAQEGMDAFFDDYFDMAYDIFAQHATVSPFHALGYALMAYVEAMVSFEVSHIQLAQERLSAAESLCHQFVKRTRRQSQTCHHHHHYHHHHQYHHHLHNHHQHRHSKSNRSPKSSSTISPEMQYEVLETNCMLMSATLQFLSNNWVDYVRAAYKLRKTYKKYEQLFEVVTGQKTSDYAHQVKQSRKRKRSRRQRKHSSATSSNMNNNTNKSKSTVLDENGPSFYCDASDIQSGVFFGIGLLSLIFSLLPPKLNKLLNTLGFHSSRPFALQLLQQSYHNQDGMYSSLSALALLAYYTNLSSFIHPALLPSSLTLTKARDIVNDIKLKYPHGKIWKLLEGKLYRMEGNLRKSVEVLRDCRRRESVCMPVLNGSIDDNNKNNYNKTTNNRHHHLTMTTTFPPPHQSMVSELALQISALSVYEMGWGQIFLGDYFQASETFFRLESMNNWSRAFYHYIATCCLYGDEEYDKAAIDFVQIPRLLARRRRSGTRLLPNEQFADRTIQRWMRQGAHLMAEKKKQNGELGSNDDDDDWRQRKGVMDGHLLQQVVLVNPLWELIYLWNGIYHVSPAMLLQMKQGLEQGIDQINNEFSNSSHPLFPCSELGRLHLLLGVVERELGNFVHAETCFKQIIAQERTCLLDHQHSEYDDMDDNKNDKTLSWAGSYAFYEMALLKCLQSTCPESQQRTKRIKEAREWLRRTDQFHHYHSTHGNNSSSIKGGSSLNYSDVSCESACMLLHIRCQLLIEKIDELLEG
ncbi:uncharacterized protein BX664DRAFT_266554 [Halteromyces radiatus]|uniref:uncharacterized protein n=1 Tax=Halteromyces radiatus TaxID=101107 RepID=UPI002220C4A1|nr:uncharacterized protein BX664DRAFT_266554 [Halteromyces radiatus]KAI8085021.1 hypothetical protein BX664DRAFT_266554 [Halteromyces radiatus]